MMDMDTLLRLKNETSSRRNFALKQAEKVFSSEERLESNCTGTRGKKALDKTRLATIQDNAFKLRPLESKENKKDAWKDCCRAIDEGGRQLNQKKKKAQA